MDVCFVCWIHSLWFSQISGLTEFLWNCSLLHGSHKGHIRVGYLTIQRKAKSDKQPLASCILRFLDQKTNLNYFSWCSFANYPIIPPLSCPDQINQMEVTSSWVVNLDENKYYGFGLTKIIFLAKPSTSVTQDESCEFFWQEIQIENLILWHHWGAITKSQGPLSKANTWVLLT